MDDVRSRLALGLDMGSLEEAERAARELQPWFAVAKVGLELYLAEGPAAVIRMQELGFEVFADLKLHDIPTTVHRAARAVGRIGVRYLNMHAAGGRGMLEAGVAGLRAGAEEAGHDAPTALAVTVLTSDADTSEFDVRLDDAVAAGCGGVVCSALEVRQVKQSHPELVVVVPGTRPQGSEHHEQARTATPAEAIRAGADLLVMGRVVVQAPDPPGAAAAVSRQIEEVIDRGAGG